MNLGVAICFDKRGAGWYYTDSIYISDSRVWVVDDEGITFTTQHLNKPMFEKDWATVEVWRV